MSKIAERIDDIIRMLGKKCPEILFKECNDPLVYMKSLNPIRFPLVLISYKESLYNDSKIYPGTCTFEIYFIDIKKKARQLLDLMQDVYDFFKNNVIQTKEDGNSVTGHKMIYQEQGLHAESNEHIIYVQRYNLLIP